MGLRPSCHVSPSVQQKSSRGAVSGGMGVQKVLCSDNTVIVNNSSSLLQSQHVSYPNNSISVSTTLSTTAPLHEYLQASNDLHDISSPAKSIQRGNFSVNLKSRDHEGTPSRSSNVVWCDVSGTCRDYSTSTFNPLNTYGKQPSAVPHVFNWLASPLRREPSVVAAQCGSCEDIGLVHNVTDSVYGARCSTQTSSPVSSAVCGEEAGYDLPVPRPAVMSDDTVNALFADMMDSGNRQSSDDVTPASVGLSRVSCAEQVGHVPMTYVFLASHHCYLPSCSSGCSVTYHHAHMAVMLFTIILTWLLCNLQSCSPFCYVLCNHAYLTVLLFTIMLNSLFCYLPSCSPDYSVIYHHVDLAVRLFPIVLNWLLYYLPSCSPGCSVIYHPTHLAVIYHHAHLAILLLTIMSTWQLAYLPLCSLGCCIICHHAHLAVLSFTILLTWLLSTIILTWLLGYSPSC